jgi:hypothetical protein
VWRITSLSEATTLRTFSSESSRVFVVDQYKVRGYRAPSVPFWISRQLIETFTAATVSVFWGVEEGPVPVSAEAAQAFAGPPLAVVAAS